MLNYELHRDGVHSDEVSTIVYNYAMSITSDATETDYGFTNKEQNNYTDEGQIGQVDVSTKYYTDENINPLLPSNGLQCVDYCYGRAMELLGIAMPTSGPKNWLSDAEEMGLKTNTTDLYDIRPQSIAVFTGGGGGWGHVIFVEGVTYGTNGTPTYVQISEANNRYVIDGGIYNISVNRFIRRQSESLAGYIYLR